MKINFDSQVQETLQLILKEQLTMLDLKQPSSKEYSCWGRITIGLLKKFDRVISLRIYKNWKYNVRGYRDIVNNILKKHGFLFFEQSGF